MQEKIFFAGKYPKMKYLAYFQSFSNTFGRSVDELEAMYREAMGVEGIVGLIIGTRPDTLPDKVVDMLARLNEEMPVIVELGAESSHDSTLALINRGHSWHDVEDAVLRLSRKGISVGLHLIAGLPGENQENDSSDSEEGSGIADRVNKVTSPSGLAKYKS